MTGQTHSLAEWASVLSLGVGVHAGFSVFYFLLVDSDSARDFDPRPLLARAIRSEAVYPLLREWATARYDARELAASAALYARLSLRDAAFTAAALLALLTIRPEALR